MTFILFSWASLATVCGFCFFLAWVIDRSDQAKKPQAPALMSLADVEAALQAARELTADELPALAATLMLPASKPKPTWTGHQCTLPGCTDMAVTRWVAKTGKTWYACPLHWEHCRQADRIHTYEMLT